MHFWLLIRKIVWLVVLWLLAAASMFAQMEELAFERIGVEEGLSQSTIKNIVQGPKGFMWFGTTDGLNRYDGYHFKTYRFHPRSAESLSNNRILCLYVDSHGTLWVGTGGGGLNRFDHEKEKFTSFLFPSVGGSSANNNYVTEIFEDRATNLWIGTRGNGLYKFNKLNQQFERVPEVGKAFTNGLQTTISSLIEVGDILWIGSEASGIAIFDEQKNQLTQFSPEKPSEECLQSNSISALLADGDSVVWIGTYDAGLYKYIVTKRAFERFPGFETLSQKRIISMMKDKSRLLVGTSSGLYSLKEDARLITYDLADPFDKKNIVESLYKDRSGVLWIGTASNGIFKVMPKATFFHVINTTTNNFNGLNDNCVHSIGAVSKNFLCVTAENGINLIHRQDNSIRYFLFSSNASDIGNMSSAKDKSGNIWFGTYQTGVIASKHSVEALYSLPSELSKNEFKVYQNKPDDPESLSTLFKK